MVRANRKDGEGFVGKYGQVPDGPSALSGLGARAKAGLGLSRPVVDGRHRDRRDGQFRRDRGAFRIEIGNEGWNFAIGDPDTTTVDFVNGLNFSDLNPALISSRLPGRAVA